MGDVWLLDLPEVCAGAGLHVEVWDGWQTRARGSGGYDAVYAVFAHHTASSAAPDDDCRYMWETADDGPIGAIYLARDGLVVVGAAGATNCQGKGGPYVTSRGTIPRDEANAYGIAVEAANNGVGEAWPDAQQAAYVTLCGALCAAYGLDPAVDVVAHWEWVAPAPTTGRKVDPAGPSAYATGSASWDMAAFRADVAAPDPDPDPPPDPAPCPPEPEVHNMLFMGRLDTNPNLTLIGDGVSAVRVRSAGWPHIEAQFAAGYSKWHQPHRDGFPLIESVDEIVLFNAAQLRALVGVELAESAGYPDDDGDG